jgi:hypothetical protein
MLIPKEKLLPSEKFYSDSLELIYIFEKKKAKQTFVYTT